MKLTVIPGGTKICDENLRKVVVGTDEKMCGKLHNGNSG